MNLPYDPDYLSKLVNGDGPFAMIKAYFDESGIHGGSTICVVCGLVLPSAKAASLSRNWQNDVLFPFLIPYFHAVEFANRSGPFRGWDDRRCRSFIDVAMSVINDTYFASFGVAAAVRTKDFLALSVDERRWLTGGQFVISEPSGLKKWRKQGAPSKPYFLLLQQVILDAVKFSQDTDFAGVHLGSGEGVNFVFDRQEEYEATARAVLSVMKRSPLSIRERMGDVVFSDKTRAVVLQVADFMAYESFVFLSARER